jgi:serine/threonine-protein kinase
MPISSGAELVNALGTYQVLGPEQLAKLQRDVQGRSPDARTLARKLLKQGWITAFQANLVLQGRGAELVLGPYLLLDRLGEGGMGQVFKARHRVMDRTVAIKIIRRERLADVDAVQRFQREIRLAAQLDHPHLVRAHDAAQAGDTHFLVMEYAEGTDLHRLVEKSGPLPVAQACAYVRQAALGLQHAAERGLVHRDVKPSNLQLTGNGAVIKILDLGLARLQTPDADPRGRAELTQVRTMMGTPDYIAPEQIADARHVDIRADIYSLGCTLYYLLAGRPPFAAAAWQEKLVCHSKVEPQPIDQLRPDVPANLGAVLRRMMAKRPEDRYAAPQAVAEALAAYCAVASPLPAVALAMPAGAGPQPSAVPATPASLANPTPAQEAGRTLAADSTVRPTPGPAGGHPIPAGNPVFAQATVLAATPAAPVPSTAPRRRRLGWLPAAAAGFLVAGAVIAVAVSQKSPQKDEPVADSTQPVPPSKEVAVKGAPQPAPPQGPVLRDEKPGVVAKMPGHGPGWELGTSIAFTPDGLRAVTREAYSLHFWDLTDRVERPAGLPMGNLGLLAVSPDGKRLAASAYNQLRLYEGKTYKEEGPVGFPNWCTALAFSPDGQTLATAELNGTRGRVRFTDHERRLPMKRSPLDFDAPVIGLAFSPDGQYLATTNGGTNGSRIADCDDKKIRLWRARDGQLVRELPGHPRAVSVAAFLADGKRLISASPFDGTLRVWSIDENDPKNVGKEVKKPIEAGEKAPNPGAPPEAHNPREITCVAFWPWGRALTGYRFGGMTLWNVETGEPLAEYPTPSATATAMALAVAISPDGHQALAALSDGVVYLYRLPPP